MKKQLWHFALLRTSTIIPVIIGLWMAFGRSWLAPGLALIAYGIYQAATIVNKTPQAEERLFLRQEKKRRGIRRNLNNVEQASLLKLLAYARQLEKMGGSPALGQELLNQAWALIENNQNSKYNAELEKLVNSLPPLHQNHSGKSEDLMERLRRECEIIYASQAEAEASTHSEPW